MDVGDKHRGRDEFMEILKMTADQLGIKDLMMQILRLYREMQNLLVSADDLMAAKSWTPFNSVCITGSNSLDQPDQWFAQAAHRLYRSGAPEHASALSYIAILLFDSGKPDALPQPLVTGGWMDYGQNGKISDYYYWYARFHSWMPDASNDGVVHRVESNHWPKWKLPFERIATLAVPLAEVTSTHELNQRIVGPLLADIGTAAT